jgi:hypothetical protein
MRNAYTINDIVRMTEKKSPYFFSPKTLKFFGQSRSSFKVVNSKKGTFIVAKTFSKDFRTGKKVDMGYSIHKLIGTEKNSDLQSIRIPDTYKTLTDIKKYLKG